jgi:hypothetical protein
MTNETTTVKSASTSDESIRKILFSIHVPEERDEAYRGLEALEKSFYSSEPKTLDERLWGLFPESVRQVLRPMLSRPSDGQNSAEILELLKTLKTKLKIMPVVKLDLAFYPEERFLDKVARWIKENVAEDAIVEINVDRTIVGGARIIFGGRYLEETLEKMLEKEFEENRTIITGMGLRK